MTKHIYRLSVEIRTDEPFKDIHDSVHAGLSMIRFPRDYSTIIRDESYNGWANCETWALNLHLSNDQGLYEMTRERVTERLTINRKFAHANDAEFHARIAGEAVYRNGRQIAEISKVAGRWLVNVSGLGVSIHEPNHATVAAALAWHGWKEG